MEGGTDLYSALCFFSEASEPARGEEEDGPGHCYANSLLFAGGKNGKRIFIAFFNVCPSSLRGYICVMNQEGNGKFKRKNKQ